jgi:hypothetical protein
VPPFVRPLVALGVLLFAGACGDSPLPGSMLGTYQVVGQSKTNSCGLGAPNPWTFDAQLSLSGSTLYWSWMDGSPVISGTLGAQLQSTLQTTGTVNADSTDAGLGPCNLTRADDLDLVLASGSPTKSFGGTISYSYTVASGSTCTDQLATMGGQFSALPCSVSYTVKGTRQ